MELQVLVHQQPSFCSIIGQRSTRIFSTAKDYYVNSLVSQLHKVPSLTGLLLIMWNFQMTSPLLYVNATCVRILVTRKLQKFVTIIALALLLHPILLPRFIYVSNAPTKYTENTPIKDFSIFCIRCSKFRWFAKTKWVRFASIFRFFFLFLKFGFFTEL